MPSQVDGRDAPPLRGEARGEVPVFGAKIAEARREHRERPVVGAREAGAPGAAGFEATGFGATLVRVVMGGILSWEEGASARLPRVPCMASF